MSRRLPKWNRQSRPEHVTTHRNEGHTHMKRVIALYFSLIAGFAVAQSVTIPPQTINVTVPGQTVTLTTQPQTISVTIPGQTISTSSGGSSSSPPPAPNQPGSSTQVPTNGATYWVYKNGVMSWGCAGNYDWSSAATPSYQDTKGGAPNGETTDVAVTITGGFGEWQPHYDCNTVAVMDVSAYANIVMLLKPTVANQHWQMYTMKVTNIVTGGDTALPASCVISDIAKFSYPTAGVIPAAGSWQAYKVPLSAICIGNGLAGGDVLYKLAIQDETGKSSNTWYVEDLGLTN